MTGSEQLVLWWLESLGASEHMILYKHTGKWKLKNIAYKIQFKRIMSYGVASMLEG